MRNPKTTRVIGTVTATMFSAATLATPFAVLAAQAGRSPAGTNAVISATTPTAPADHTSPGNPVAEAAPASAVISDASVTLPVAPAVPVLLTDGVHAARTITTHGATVAEALQEVGITLTHTDRVRPALSMPVTPNLPIVVTRVRLALENRSTAIPCGSVFKMSASVAPGHVQAGHGGVPGVLTKTFLVGYVNERPTSHKLVKTTVTRRPIPAETLAGIRVREARALPSRAGTYNRMRAISMTATGYSPYEGSASGRCATGMRAGYGVVAVDPRVIHLGSRLYVEGYGYAVAGDTGGAIKGHRIDLGHTTTREAASVGRRHVTVWVLNPTR